MTQALSIVGSLNNGVSSQLLANINTSRSMASDLASSIFNTSTPVSYMPSTYLNGPGMGMGMYGMGCGMGMYGMGYGMGMYNPLMMNQMYQQIQASNAEFQNQAMDKQSDWNVRHAWTNDINNYQIGIKDEEFANKITQLNNFIKDKNADAANDAYQELLSMCAKKYGKETTGNHRLDADNCMKAKVNELYRNQTGSDIAEDIDRHCRSRLENAARDGFGLLFGSDGHQLSKESFKAIVTGQDEDTIIGNRRSKALEPIVKTASAVGLPLACAGAGALIGGPVGAGVGLLVGGVAQIIGNVTMKK